MSWGFATYIDQLAADGKKVLALPTLVNAWLGPQPGQTLAGQYPSGGPTSAMIPIWEAVAPSVDIIAPDIYVEDSEPVMREYSRGGRALFIPEARFRVADLFLAIARYDAIGYCAFGVEEGRPGNQYFTASTLLVSQTAEIVEAQAAGLIEAVYLTGAEPQVVTIGDYTITVYDTRALFSAIVLDVGVDGPQAKPSIELEPETRAGRIPSGLRGIPSIRRNRSGGGRRVPPPRNGLHCRFRSRVGHRRARPRSGASTREGVVDSRPGSQRRRAPESRPVQRHRRVTSKAASSSRSLEPHPNNPNHNHTP